MTAPAWGAQVDDWDRLGWAGAGLTEDLLPVVSNPHATVSPGSDIADPGKVPSEYNAHGQLRGLAGWTGRTTTQRQVDRWAQQPDYGICIQTRQVRALDVDIPDAPLAAEVAQFIEARLGPLPRRQRANSAKFLLAFHLPGELAKRKLVAEHGIIEFLANGQQFVAVGTHPSGARYEWRDGLPDTFPTLTPEQFEDLWSALATHFSVAPATEGGAYTPRKRGETVAMDDPLADHLHERALVLREHQGGLVVECPWAAEHTTGATGDGSTVYYPAGTRGYEHGAFKCLHGHCDGRTTFQFGRAVGYVDEASTPEAEFGNLDDAPEGTDEPSGSSPAAGNPPATTPDAEPDESTDTPYNLFRPSDFPTIAATLRDQRFGGKAPTLRRWNNSWYLHDGACFRELSVDSMGVRVHRFLVTAKRPGEYDPKTKVQCPPVPFEPAKRHTEEVLHALRSLTLLDEPRAPTWAPGCTRDPATRGMRPEDIVSLDNGLFHVPTKTLAPHTPAFFTLNALPFTFDPAAECPQWREFLKSLWPDDPQSIETLQEVVGYLLTADTSQHKIFSLVGPPRGGKGLIARIITALIGLDNVCGPSLRSLSTQFGLEALIGKLVAIVGDARSGGKDVQAAIEALLSISGEDTLSIDRKNKGHWAGKLAARIVILSNETLSLPDASGALAGRMVVLKLTRSWLGKEDRSLEGRLLTELPGIFRWALEGRDRLKARGYFIQPESSGETIEQMRELNSPAHAFVEDCCELGVEFMVPKRQLYAAYRTWATGGGIAPPSEEIVSKNLLAAFPQLQTTRPRVDGRPGSRQFTGIRIRPALQDEFDAAEL